MIPNINSSGNLPLGIYSASIEEVIKRFQGKNLKRKQLTGSLVRFHSFVRVYVEELYLVGSYVSTKPAPRDLDIMIVFQQNFDWTGANAKTLLDYQLNPRYHLHLHICRHNDRGRRRKLLRLFATTRDNPPLEKGFIKLEL